MTLLLGRDAELAQLTQALASGARLLTLHGPAGIGKTALAQAFAALIARDEPAREVLFCDLSEAREAGELCAVLARRVGLRVGASADLEQTVAQLGLALHERGPLLVVLDNLEQLVEATPATLARWVLAAERACFVVTSRERLRLPHERCVDLTPLEVPALDETDPARIGQCAAVQLFVERARARRADFALSPEQAPALAAIVRELDGIPLAIELCAARVGVLGLEQLRERLSHRLELLARGMRGARPRQATMRGAVDWSWQLLEHDERVALARFSVFRGGFDLDAAQALLPEGTHALEVVQSLDDKSMLRADAPESAQGERRFRLSLCVREYAAEQLAHEGDRAEAEALHAEYFLSRAGGWALGVEGPGGSALLRKLELDIENLEAVHRRAVRVRPATSASAERALRAAIALDAATSLRGPVAPLLAKLELALRESTDDTPPYLRVMALLGVARARWLAGQSAQSTLALEGALDAAHAAALPALEGLAATYLAALHAEQCRPNEARACFERAGRTLEPLEDPWLLGNLALFEGYAAADLGQPTRAAHRAHASLALFQRAGHERGAALARTLLDWLAVEAGADAPPWEQPDPAELDVAHLGIQRVGRGRMHHERGDLAQARADFEAAAAIHRRLGQARMEGFALTFLGDLSFEQGALDDAHEHYARALAALRSGGDLRNQGTVLAALGAVEATRNARAPAADSLAQAELLAVAHGAAAPAMALCVRLYGAHLDLARSRDAMARGATHEAAALRESARERALLAEREDPSLEAPPARCWVQVRLALRLLRAALDASGSPAQPAQSVLRAHPQGWWFRLSDSAARVSLERHRSLRLILVSLLAARVEKPGKGLSIAELFEAGWPEQRIDPDAAANRVHVGLTQLRKLGLREALVRRDDELLLDPALELLFEREPGDGARE